MDLNLAAGSVELGGISDMGKFISAQEQGG